MQLHDATLPDFTPNYGPGDASAAPVDTSSAPAPSSPAADYSWLAPLATAAIQAGTAIALKPASKTTQYTIGANGQAIPLYSAQSSGAINTVTPSYSYNAAGQYAPTTGFAISPMMLGIGGLLALLLLMR